MKYITASPAIVRLTIIGLLSCTLASCGVSKQLDNSTQDATIALDKAMSQITTQSSSWQSVLTNISSQLPKDIQSTFRVEIDQLVERAVAQTGTEFRCDTDFLGGRAVETLQDIKALILHQPMPITVPKVCHAVPDQLNLGLDPERRAKVAFVGYDFDHRDAGGQLPQVVVLNSDGSVIPVDGKFIAQTTHYQITLNTGVTNGLPFTDKSQKLELLWNNKVLSEVNIQQPTPPPPPPPPPTQIERKIGYFIHYGNLLGDSNTDSQDPRGLMLNGCVVSKVELEKVDKDGKPDGARGRTVGTGSHSGARIDVDEVGTNRTLISVKWHYPIGEAIRYNVYYDVTQPDGVQCWPE